MKTAAEILKKYTPNIDNGIGNNEFMNGYNYGQATEMLRQARSEKDITEKEYHAAKELLYATYFSMIYYPSIHITLYKNRFFD